jgi:hypothetical protein
VTKYTLAIVGAKFRPPAEGLLAVLPLGTKLIVRREPSNIYDINAMMVLARTEDFATPDWVKLMQPLDSTAGYGSDIDDILASPEWHLGYIPRQDALLLAPRMDAADAREALGVLTFSAEGHPRVQFSIEEE